MNLSAAHYDSIMREYDNQRLENMHALNERTQKVYDRFPEIRQIDEQISDLAKAYASSFTSEGHMSFEEYKDKLSDLRMEKEALLKQYHPDYKDVDLVSRFVSEKGKILPRRVTGTCAKHQRTLTATVKRTRIMALIPFTIKD